MRSSDYIEDSQRLPTSLTSKMSTTVSKTQLSNIIPKSGANLNKMDDKPRFTRSSSIDTIKKLNTYICSPQSYLLPAILTTWLKTGQNGLQASTERTIFMFRSLIFGSFLFKFLLNGTKAGGQNGNLDLKTVLQQIAANIHQQFLIALESAFVISVAFKLVSTVLFVQTSMCIFYLSQTVVPLGLIFLLGCMSYIVFLGYRINRFFLMNPGKSQKH